MMVNKQTNTVDELSSEEEVEIMSDNNCREYSENDYVSLKNGGEGRILKIIYVVMNDEEEVLFFKETRYRKYHYKRHLIIFRKR